MKIVNEFRTMITEDYVSLEIAKLLKEKGFKHWCYKSYGTAVYHKGEPISPHEEYELKDEGKGDEIEYVEGGYLYDFGCDNSKKDAKVWAAPSIYVTMKWLREAHKIGIFPSIYSIYYGEKDGIMEHHFGTAIINLNNYELMTDDMMPMPTYEEACEVAIKYCLENLI